MTANITTSPELPPFVTPERYAELSGMKLRTVNSMMEQGFLPYYQPAPRGNRYINMIATTRMANELYEQQKHNAPWAVSNGLR